MSIEGANTDNNCELIEERIDALEIKIQELKPLAFNHRDVRGRSRQLVREVQSLPTFLSRRLLTANLSQTDLQAIGWVLETAFENLAFAAALFRQDLVDAEKARAELSQANLLIGKMWKAAGEIWAEAPAEANRHFLKAQRALGDLDYEVTINEAREAMRKAKLVIEQLPPLDPESQRRSDEVGGNVV